MAIFYPNMKTGDAMGNEKWKAPKSKKERWDHIIEEQEKSMTLKEIKEQSKRSRMIEKAARKRMGLKQ